MQVCRCLQVLLRVGLTFSRIVLDIGKGDAVDKFYLVYASRKTYEDHKTVDVQADCHQAEEMRYELVFSVQQWIHLSSKSDDAFIFECSRAVTFPYSHHQYGRLEFPVAGSEGLY